MTREKSIKIKAARIRILNETPEQKAKREADQRLLVDILEFIDELRNRHPEIVGSAIEATEGIKEVEIVYKDSLSEEKEEEIRQLIVERYPKLTVRFIEEKIHKQEIRKRFGTSGDE